MPDVANSMPNLPNTKNADITKLVIDDTESKVTFYTKKGSQWVNTDKTNNPSYYLDLEMLLGAIFTEDMETYECISKRAFSLLENVAEIKNAREKDLKDDDNPNCVNIHTNAVDRTDRIMNDAGTLSKGGNFDVAKANIDSIKTEKGLLNNYNSNAEKNSCVMIY